MTKARGQNILPFAGNFLKGPIIYQDAKKAIPIGVTNELIVYHIFDHDACLNFIDVSIEILSSHKAFTIS